MKYVFVVIDRNLGTVVVYDTSEVSIEALQEKYPGDIYYITYLPVHTTT